MTEESISIGGRKVIYSTHFFCPEDEKVLLKFKASGIALSVEFKFVTNQKVKGAKIESDGLKEGVFHVRLTNWPEEPVSAFTPFPWRLAKTSTQRISLAGGGFKVGKVYSFSVQFMSEPSR